MSILLSVPAQEWMWSDSAVALIQAATVIPPDSKIHFDTSHYSLAEKRNVAVRVLLGNSLDHILFIDSDMQPRPEHVQALLEHTDLPIVSGLCFTRTPPYRPAFKPKDSNVIKLDKNTGLMTADWTGMAFTLIRREVFEKMYDPWFEETEPGRGEDVAFCERSQYPVFVDSSILVPHTGTVRVTARNARYLTQWTE